MKPTRNLDSQNSARVVAIFRALRKAGRAVVCVTHDPSRRGGGRRVHMLDGAIENRLASIETLNQHETLADETHLARRDSTPYS